MKKRLQPVVSFVVPFYNEAASLPHFYADLRPVLDQLDLPYEIIFVNDGSLDRSATVVRELATTDPNIHVVTLSRNFGKEAATTAGIHAAAGEAIMTLDADGQFPADRIPIFIEKWRAGAHVVVGRREGRSAGLLKRVATAMFYGVFQRLMGVHIDPDTSDFRLIDREVQMHFNKLTERRRMAKSLIDWLGYERVFVPYTENPRVHGQANYSYQKLIWLAMDSTISHSVSPLHFTAYIGAVVLPVATLMGIGMVANWLAGDPLGLHITGSGYALMAVIFLLGVVLLSQGIIGLYLSHIHAETQNRPLYIIDESQTDPWRA